jgi:hypothetical protein
MTTTYIEATPGEIHEAVQCLIGATVGLVHACGAHEQKAVPPVVYMLPSAGGRIGWSLHAPMPEDFDPLRAPASLLKLAAASARYLALAAVVGGIPASGLRLVVSLGDEDGIVTALPGDSDHALEMRFAEGSDFH